MDCIAKMAHSQKRRRGNTPRYCKIAITRFWTRLKCSKTHAKVCSTKVKEVYIGGKFKANDTIFERLERVNINIKEEDRYYKYVSTYD